MSHPKTIHSLFILPIALAILAFPAIDSVGPDAERNERPHATAIVESADPSSRPPKGSESERPSLELEALLSFTSVDLRCLCESDFAGHRLDAACLASLQKLHIRLNL